EHALILPHSTSQGNLLLVGCLHPGLRAFVSSAESELEGKIQTFIGGMHGFKDMDYLKSTRIRKMYAGHCTKHANLLKTVPNLQFVSLHVGLEIEF
ncbi:MAG: hypothetical protein ACTSRK_18460, partial [Promethearchaeota archaeon]